MPRRIAWPRRSTAFYHNRLWLLIGLVTIGILASLGLAIAVVVFAITRPINRLTQTMMTLASGSTEITVPATDRGDEIGDMARAVQVFLNQALAVRGLTTQIMENIRRVANAASQASSAVSQVSDGSNIQLNALKQSSGALEQSTQAISEVARGTQQASERARNAAGLVDKEIKQMTSMVELVGAISENSTQISRIADAISRIASQTNMLSLNASIEAARAGEHGRGFAVVAEEVGKLAGGSRSLAQDIAEQVRQATEQAEKGVALAREVSSKMQEIAGGVAETDEADRRHRDGDGGAEGDRLPPSTRMSASSRASASPTRPRPRRSRPRCSTCRDWPSAPASRSMNSRSSRAEERARASPWMTSRKRSTTWRWRCRTIAKCWPARASARPRRARAARCRTMPGRR